MLLSLFLFHGWCVCFCVCGVVPASALFHATRFRVHLRCVFASGAWRRSPSGDFPLLCTFGPWGERLGTSRMRPALPAVMLWTRG